MRRLIIFIGLFITIMVPAICQANILFESEEMSVGVLDEGKKIDLIFNFQNTGDEKLIIKKVNTACGCVITNLSQREFEPGEKGSIEVNYNSKGRYGRVNQQIVIFTNTIAKYHRLTIIGTVIRNSFGFASIPTEMRKINFDNAVMGEEYRKEIIMTNEGNRSLKIIKTAHSPQIITEFEKSRLLPNETCKILIRFVPKETGEFASLLYIETSALKGNYITIKITANVNKNND